MASCITEQDVNQLLYFATFSAAQKVGVREAEWESVAKLSALVRSANPNLGVALDAFTKAHIEWFKFSEKLDAEGRSGKLSMAENEQLMNVIAVRDSSRSVLISALRCRA